MHSGHLRLLVYPLHFGFVGSLDDGVPNSVRERLVRISDSHKFIPYPFTSYCLAGFHAFVQVLRPLPQLVVRPFDRLNSSVRSVHRIAAEVYELSEVLLSLFLSAGNRSHPFRRIGDFQASVLGVFVHGDLE
jgi:hypothetical protein